MFQGSLKDVSRSFKGCFNEVLRLFTESLKGVSMKFKGWIKEVSSVFEGSF